MDLKVNSISIRDTSGKKDEGHKRIEIEKIENGWLIIEDCYDPSKKEERWYMKKTYSAEKPNIGDMMGGMSNTTKVGKGKYKKKS